jgi:hypothetical protein
MSRSCDGGEELLFRASSSLVTHLCDMLVVVSKSHYERSSWWTRAYHT